ncbi:hypothetical protein BgiMline_031353 [Biomphalaria glabrata]|uniref:Uncharacterized protein n=1 Tax=Biomphalaria glabrata TaxID=6526 RepID=A0A2C9KZR9_BIOGL
MSNSSTETPGILDVTTDKPEQAETSCTTIIIISVLAVVITILLIVVVVYFIYFKRKLVKRRNSPNLRLKYLNHPHYNNMEELKSLKVDKDQNLSNYETRYANIVKERNVDQVVPKDPRNTEMAQGRYRNDEGLIYITIDHSDLQSRSSKSYTSKASQPETESNYVTIDPFKTKHFK